MGCVEQPSFLATLLALMDEKPPSRSTSTAALMMSSLVTFLAAGMALPPIITYSYA